MALEILGSIFMFLVIVGVIAYFVGWIKSHSQEQSSSVEIKTGEMKVGSIQAVDAGRNFLEVDSRKFRTLSETKRLPHDSISTTTR